MSSTILSHSPARSLPLRKGRIDPFRLFGLWRSRRALRRLDDALLKDIGLSRTEADKEAGRPVWDVPSNWLR